jgi:putative flippase GtrA
MNKFSKYIITSLFISALSIGMLYIFTSIFNIYYMLSAVLVSGILAITGFVVNYLWVWKSKHKDAKIVITTRFAKYIVVGGFVTLTSWGLLYILTEFASVYYILSATICWIIGTTITFTANNYWTYSK